MVFSTLKEIGKETSEFPSNSRTRVLSLTNFIETIMTFIIDPSNAIRVINILIFLPFKFKNVLIV